MKSIMFFWTFAAVCVAAADCDILVSREGACVEHWRAPGAGGAWQKVGVFLDGRKAGIHPTGITASADGLVYVGDGSEGGSVKVYGTDGAFRGVVATTGFRPDQLCISPDGKWLYVSTLEGEKRGVWRYACATGRGGQAPFCAEGLQPRHLAFGTDGFLYAGCRSANLVVVYDVSGEKAVEKGRIGVGAFMGGFALTGMHGAELVVPGMKTEIVDLVRGATSFPRGVEPFTNVIGVCTVAGKVFAGDWPAGVVRTVEADSKPVATGVRAVCALLNLTETTNGAIARARAQAAVAQRALGKPLVYATPSLPPGMDFARMSFNNPDATIFLKAGFGVEALRVLDYDGDGQLDIVVTCGWGTWPWAGTYLYRNPTPKGQKNPNPIFPKYERIDPATLPPVSPGGTFADGRPIGDVHYTAVPESKEFWVGRKSQGGPRLLRDLDGDGVQDLVIGASDRNMSAWQDRYDARGNWKDIQLRGFVYWCRGLGEEKYGEPQMLYMENDLPVEVYGQARILMEDYDHDGDLDLILFDFMDTISYFENVGTKTKPLFTAGRFLRAPDGTRLHGDLCMPYAISVDWDGDGRPDILFGEEDSRVAWCRNTGTIKNGLPVFEKPNYFLQKADELHFGVLSCPWTYDWDDDGDLDIICGNSHGQIAFIENLSGPRVEKPRWAPPVYLTEPDGKFIWPIAGKNGSIQGPCESKWGYATLSVADWDGDGLPDIMANNIMGEVMWWKNIGTRTKPKLDYARRVEVEWDGPQPELAWGWKKPELQKNPKDLLTQWRTTPVMVDWNGDGLTDLIMLDQDGYLALFERARHTDGTLLVRHPRRAFLSVDGHPLRLRCTFNNYIGCGRRKFAVCDWDGDEKMDLVMNGGPNAEVMIQTASSNGTWSFRSIGPLARHQLSSHDPQPAVCDFNGDGVPDLIFGAMDGYLYYLRNPRSETK